MDVLHKDNFVFGPISINQIENNLFLGSLSAAKDLETLNKHKITHIITIDTCPLPRHILELQHISFKFIQLSDQPKEDLLSHLDDTYNFIEEAFSNGGTVFVHCYFGVSRSATVVIAYVMKKHQLRYTEAFEKVKAKRRIVFPNQGFVSQLKLYKEMGYKIDHNQMRYKLFRLSLAADRVRKVKILPQEYIDLIQPDPELCTTLPVKRRIHVSTRGVTKGLPMSKPESNVYRCKKCRRVLASESNLIVHKDQGVTCTKTIFLEPIAWMNASQVTQGKLHCPKCKHKVGSFSWIVGSQCPCGTQVAPAFYLVPSKVDYTNVVKNVEVTF